MSEPPRRPPEPEIIPPDRPKHDERHGRWQEQGGPHDQSRIWIWRRDQGRTRLYGGQPGPFSLILFFAAVAALGVLGFFVFVGALAIALPVIGTLILAALVIGVLRRL